MTKIWLRLLIAAELATIACSGMAHRRLHLPSRRRLLCSAFGLVAQGSTGRAALAAPGIMTASEIDRLLEEAQRGKSGESISPDALSLPRAFEVSEPAKTAPALAPSSSQGDAPSALTQAAQTTIAGTVGIAVAGAFGLGFTSGQAAAEGSAEAQALSASVERLEAEVASLVEEREAAVAKVAEIEQACAYRLQASLGEFEALAADRDRLAAELSAARDAARGVVATDAARARDAAPADAPAGTALGAERAPSNAPDGPTDRAGQGGGATEEEALGDEATRGD